MMIYFNTVLPLTNSNSVLKNRCPKFQDKNQLSFKSIPFYDIKLNKLDQYGKDILTPALFSKLEVKSEQDKQAVLKIKQKWKKTDHGKAFSDNFLENKYFHTAEYYVIELKNNLKSLYENILCVIKTDFLENSQTGKRNLHLCLLQGAPDVLNVSPRNIKGLGELAVCSVVKLAKQKRADGIEIISTNNNFYNHISDFQVLKMIDDECSLLYLDKSKFDPFLNGVISKYSL